MLDSKKMLEIGVRAADSKRAEEILALDIQEVSLVADYFLIMHAKSERQLLAIVDEILEKEEEAGASVQRVEGRAGGKWVLIDLGDVIVHVFKTEEREFYQLEKLWADAAPVELGAWITENE